MDGITTLKTTPNRKWINLSPHSTIICTSLLMWIGATVIWDIHSYFRMGFAFGLALLGIGVFFRRTIPRYLSLAIFITADGITGFMLWLYHGIRHAVAWELILAIIASCFITVVLIKWNAADYPLPWGQRSESLTPTKLIRIYSGWLLSACLIVIFLVSAGFHILTLNNRLEITDAYLTILQKKEAATNKAVLAEKKACQDLIDTLPKSPQVGQISDISVSWSQNKAKVYLYSDTIIYFEKSKTDNSWQFKCFENPNHGNYRGGHEGWPRFYWASDIWY